MDLFTITCVTCQARLKVRDPAVIGRIVACPKCGSMVQVRAPAGWQPVSARITPKSAPRPAAPGSVAEAPPASPARLPRARRISEEEMALLLRDTQPVSDAGIDLESISADDLQVAPPVESTTAAPPAPPVEHPETRRPWPAWARWTLWAGVTTVVAAIVMTICLVVAWPDVPPNDADRLVAAPEPESQVSDRTASEGEAPAATDETDAATTAEQAESVASLSSLPGLPDPVAMLTEYLEGGGAPADDLLVEAEPAVDGEDGADDAVDGDPAAEGGIDPAVEEGVKPAPLRIDAAARLAQPLPRLVVQDMPLVDYYRTLSRLSAMPISLDLEALARAGLTPRDPVTLDLRDVTVAEALTAPLEGRGLGIVDTDFAIRITSSSGADEATVRVPIGDLAVGANVEDVRQLMLRFVAPRIWSDFGGQAVLRAEGSDLIVEGPGPAGRAVEEFMARLRFARSGRAAADVSPLATRWQLARALLDAPLTANFQQPTRLAQIVEHLERKSGLAICVDWAGLADEGVGAHVAAKLHATEIPAWDAIAALVAPLGLEARIVDAQTLEIVGPGRAEEIAVAEFYPVRLLAADAAAGAKLIDRIRSDVAPETWSAAGGRGDIAYDAPSACLIVRQTSAGQVAVERFLETLSAR